MTAEIAIANRSGLALAADSAVTIRIGNKLKIYDSAEKIFEFSRKQPIGFMVYNNIEFVNVPLDVLVRKFRNEEVKVYDEVVNAADHFLNYLESFPHDAEDEASHLLPLLFYKFKQVNSNASKKIVSIIQNFVERKIKKLDPSPEEVMVSHIQRETKKEEGRAIAGYLSDRTLDQFIEQYGSVVNGAADRTFQTMDLTDEMRTELHKYAFALIKSNDASDLYTGFVFGGFGKDHLFPRFCYCEIDGIYFGKLKIIKKIKRNIDRQSSRAAIIPFAQKEMAERFINGFDSDFESDINKVVRAAINKILDAKQDAFSQKERDEAKKAVFDNFDSMINRLKNNSRKEILDMVSFMSKNELAEMALVLVELTSKKRRFSTDQETVGGPIDVAIITRNEGFIWFERKHYFDHSLNPGYFTRVYSSLGGTDGGKAPRTKRRKSLGKNEASG